MRRFEDLRKFSTLRIVEVEQFMWAHKVGSLCSRLIGLMSKVVTFEGGIRIEDGNAFYTFWHEDILYLCCWAQKERLDLSNFALILSRHRDAELAVPFVRSLGIEPIRGSSRRGFLSVARKLLETGKPIIVIADGPRGPYRRFKKSILSIASKLGRRVYHFEFEAKRFFRLPTWDRFKVPLPGSVARIIPVNPYVLETV